MHATRSTTSLRGQLVSFNLSPKGVPEGMIVRQGDGELVQVNFDPELAGQVTRRCAEGQPVEIDAAPFPDAHPDAHPVYEMVQVTDGVTGGVLVANGPGETDVTVRGTVVRVNHARRGEVNGGILDTGEFVHLRPHGVRAIGGLRIGQALDATGAVRPGWSGSRVIEARTANGVPIGKPPHKSGHKANHHL